MSHAKFFSADSNITCDFPDYAGATENDFAGVPDSERDRILHDNAQALYF